MSRVANGCQRIGNGGETSVRDKERPALTDVLKLPSEALVRSATEDEVGRSRYGGSPDLSEPIRRSSWVIPTRRYEHKWLTLLQLAGGPLSTRQESTPLSHPRTTTAVFHFIRVLQSSRDDQT